MNDARRYRTVTLALLACGMLACGRKSSTPALPRGTVAIVNGVPIVGTELEAEIERMPAFTRDRYRSPESRRALLDSIIRTRALVSEARRRGYDKHPEYLRRVEQQLVTFLMERALGEDAKPDDFSDGDAEVFYREHLAEFMARERVRVSEILVTDRKLADKLLKEARALRKSDAAGFAALAVKHSVAGPFRMGNGDLGVLQRETSVQAPEVTAAAFALAKPGDISDVIAAPDGFHILRLTERLPQQARPFAEVKAEIKKRLFSERRSKAGPKLVEDSRTNSKVQIFESELAETSSSTSTVATSSPSTPAR